MKYFARKPYSDYKALVNLATRNADVQLVIEPRDGENWEYLSLNGKFFYSAAVDDIAQVVRGVESDETKMHEAISRGQRISTLFVAAHN